MSRHKDELVATCAKRGLVQALDPVCASFLSREVRGDHELSRELTDRARSAEVSPDEAELILAVRYAAGRRTYVVSEIVGEVKRRWESLSSAAQVAILLQAIEVTVEKAGDSCDLVEWQSLVDQVASSSQKSHDELEPISFV